MKNSELKKKYDLFAKEYEDKAISDNYRAFDKISKWAIRKIKLDRAYILDLGCGTGLSSINFFEKNYEVIGIDISQKMLDEAKRFPYKKLICQDLEEDLKVENNYFDIITLVGVMEYIKNPRKLFIEIKNKLKKTGIFLLTVPSKKSKILNLDIFKYSENEIEEIFSKSGFIVNGKKKFLGYYKTVNGKRNKVNYLAYLLVKD
jgi:predicted TPR repeat methyltransferase